MTVERLAILGLTAAVGYLLFEDYVAEKQYEADRARWDHAMRLWHRNRYA